MVLEGAADLLQQAVEEAGRPELAAAGHFALGNAGVRAVEQAMAAAGGAPADPQAAIAGLTAAARSYRRALDLAPDWEDAAHNLEVTRLRLRQLREQLPPPERSTGEPQGEQDEQGEQERQNAGQDAAGADGADRSPEQAGGAEEPPEQQPAQPQPAAGEAPDLEPDELARSIIAEEEERAEQRRRERLRTEPVERDW